MQKNNNQLGFDFGSDEIKTAEQIKAEEEAKKKAEQIVLEKQKEKEAEEKLSAKEKDKKLLNAKNELKQNIKVTISFLKGDFDPSKIVIEPTSVNQEEDDDSSDADDAEDIEEDSDDE